MDNIETPTGAPQTETVSAGRAAADAGNVSEFLQSDRDARLGKPHEAVTREKKADPAPAKPDSLKANADKWTKGDKADKPAEPVKPVQAKGPSAADKDADERLRTRVRDAVDIATAESRRQIKDLTEKLEAAAKPKAEAKPTTAPGVLTGAQIAEYQKMPGAPKLDDKDPATGEFLYSSGAEHAVALSQFISHQQATATAEDAKKREAQVLRSKAEAERFQKFGSRVEDWKTKNADKLVDKVIKGADGAEMTVKALPLSEEVHKLHGWAMWAHLNDQRRAQGLKPLPPSADQAIAEHITEAEDPGEIGVYLSNHPQDLAYMRAATSENELAARFGRIVERATGSKAATTAAPTGGTGTVHQPQTPEAAKRAADKAVDRSLSSVKPPDTTLGKGSATGDPLEQAVIKQDIGAFLEIDKQNRIERAGWRRK